MTKKPISKQEKILPISEIPIYASQSYTGSSTLYFNNTAAQSNNILNTWTATVPQSTLYEPSTFEIVNKINEIIRRLNGQLPNSLQKLPRSANHASAKKKPKHRA